MMTNAQQGEAVYNVMVEKDQVMRTRDGVTLRADVYRPDASGNFPVLLVRTPYDKGAGMALTEKDYFPPRGYVVVVQDTRGRHSSGGDFYPFVHEARDGYDAVEWAAALPWSNGKVGTVGQSYLALTQYYAASLRPPHLRVAAPVSGPVSYFENFAYRHGALELGWMLAYFMFMARDTLARKGIYDQHRERLTATSHARTSRWRRSSATPTSICRCATGANASKTALRIWPTISATGLTDRTGRRLICVRALANSTRRCFTSDHGTTCSSTTPSRCISGCATARVARPRGAHRS